MNVELISWPTMDPATLAGKAAAKCYNGANYDRSLRVAMDGGHLSVAEHANFTFEISGVSRVLLAQLTRHRIASFSVQSQRYVSMADGFDFVVPPSISALGEAEEAEFIRQMNTMHAWYCQWQEKLGGAKEESNEDARFVLPNAAATRLLVTMNARELMHFFELRCCNRAQWEIRDMAWHMLKLSRKIAPELFNGAGPGCVRGKCPEGKRSCNKPYGGVNGAEIRS